MSDVVRVFHFTAVVRDCDAAVSALQGLFGACVLHRASDAIAGVEMHRAMLWLGDNLLEVIEPVGASPFTAFLDRFGGGLNSVGLTVADAGATEARLGALGVEVAMRYGPDMYATRTGATAGLALQWTSRDVHGDPRLTGTAPRPEREPVVAVRRVGAAVALVADPAAAAGQLGRVLDAPAVPVPASGVWNVPMGDVSLALHPVPGDDDDPWGAPQARPRLLALSLQVDDAGAAEAALASHGIAVVGRNATGAVLDPSATPVVVQLCEGLLPGDPRIA